MPKEKLPLLKRIFSDPESAIRKMKNEEEPFKRPEVGSERYEKFKEAYQKQEAEDKEKDSMYELINRRVRERLNKK